MSPQSITHCERSLQIDTGTDPLASQVGARQRFFPSLEIELLPVDRDHCQTAAVDADAVADRGILGDDAGLDRQSTPRGLIETATIVPFVSTNPVNIDDQSDFRWVGRTGKFGPRYRSNGPAARLRHEREPDLLGFRAFSIFANEISAG